MNSKKKQKPNAYSLFVAERSAQTRTPIHFGFERFKHEWEAVPEAVKAQYKARAMEKRDVVKKEQAQEEEQNARMVFESERKRKMEDYMEQPGGKHHTSQEPSSSRSSWDFMAPSSSTSLVSSPVPVPDSWMDYEGEVYVDRNSVGQPELDFNEPEVISEEDSMGAIWEYYNTIEDISKLDVFVISCVPVIYASGSQKSAVLPLNRPLELAITTFNLKEGRGIGFIHAFLDPGNMPSLRHTDADECRLERHGIPYAKNSAPDDDSVQEFYRTCKVNEDYLDMYTRLLNFLGVRDVANAHKYRMPPVCCPLSELEVSAECVRWLHAKAEQEIKKQNLSLVLPRLQFASLEAFAQIATFHKITSESPVRVFSKNDPLKSIFASHKYYISLQTLNCRFHNGVVSTKACALGSVRASCFEVLAFLFTLYDLTPDQRFLYFDGRAGEKADSDEEMDDG